MQAFSEEHMPITWLQGTESLPPLSAIEEEHYEDAETFDAFFDGDDDDNQMEWYDCAENDLDSDTNPVASGDSSQYEGAPITLSKSMTLILLFAMRYSLSGPQGTGFESQPGLCLLQLTQL